MPMYPRDRLLAFLAKIANEPGPDLEPRDWLEYYLDKIAENGGGGGGAGVMFANLTYVGGEFAYRLDKTYSEMLAAIQAGTLVIIVDRTEQTAFFPVALTAVSYFDEDEEVDTITASGACATNTPSGAAAHALTVSVFPGENNIFYSHT